MEKTEMKAISRRQFVKSSGALIISFNLSGPVSRLLAQSAGVSAAEPEATALDSWLAIAQDGSITVFTSKVELGTGIETALAQIVAEELDVPFRRIKMDLVDTNTTVDQGSTVASRSLERAGPQLRQAAAAARQELLKLASARLATPVEQLTVKDGVVSVNTSPAKKISYGSLIGGKRFNVGIEATGTGWDMKLAPNVRAKDPQNYRIVGTSVPRVDLPRKFTGEFPYVHGFRVPGMLHGRVVRPPVVNSKPASVDQDSVGHIPGVVKVVEVGSFVGVVAKTEWAAIHAARTLKVTWTTPATKLPANPDDLYSYLRTTKSFRDQVVADRGNPELALSKASKTFQAEFRWPFQLHGMIGPSCAIADVRGDRATIWAGSQGPFRTRKDVADLLGLPEKNVRVVYQEGSGCYGRLSADDVAQDAAVLSRTVGKPVRVQWMREEEHGWEPKGQAQLIMVRAGVDAQGKVIAWDFVDRAFPWTEAQGMPLLASRQIGRKPTAQGSASFPGAGGQIYTFDNQKVTAALIPWVQPDPTPLRTSNLRAPGDLGRCFASESMMDEIASALGVDPIQFRIRHLSNNKRAVEGLLATAKAAGWKERPSPASASTGSIAVGRGVALGDRSNTITVAIAEVEVNRSNGEVAVKRVTLAHDCGLIVNPDGLKNQMQGCVIQGVSRALLEEVQFDPLGVKNVDWKSYPILTFQNVPEIEVVLLNRPEMPSLDGSEAPIVPVPAAIANAIFDAVGVRLRDVPLTPQRVLSAVNSDERLRKKG